jgi:hypothetical protein
MPRIVGRGSSRARLVIIAVIVLFAFTPLSRALLDASDGSFSPTPFTSLALRSPSDPTLGVQVGDLVPVLLTNHTGSTRTYHWSATQHGVAISIGSVTLSNGNGAKINVPTNFGRAGELRIGINGTQIFVTVNVAKP